MEVTDEILAEISYVQISKHRMNVVKTLKGEVKFPSRIAEDVGISTSHVSKVLSELKEHGLVECINPELRKGRLYRLTDKGETVCENLTAYFSIY